MVDGTLSAFVCRDDALSAVTSALRRRPVLVLVDGEAGIGKTRLVQECLRSGSAANHTVLWLQCLPVEEPSPLGPVVEGLRRLRERISDVQLSPVGGVLRPLLPEWAADLPESPEPLPDAAARRHWVHRALDELINQLGVNLLVLEDAHWADAATLELLVNGLSSQRDRSIVVTYRREEVPANSLLWQLISRRPPGWSWVRAELQPLDVPGIRQVVASMLGIDAVSAAFAELLHERTGGLPLAVEECLRLLQERGDLIRRGNGWARRALADIRVPPTVRDSVLARFERLDPNTRAVLEAAAVLGEPTEVTLLAAVASLDGAACRSAVAAGLRMGLLSETGRGRVVRFRHVLAAEAVEEQISVGRFRLHQRAGDALRMYRQPPVARVARHYREAGDVENWVRFAEQAADLAVQCGDDRTAVTVLYEVLASSNHCGERRARLARKLGAAAAGGAAALNSRAGQVIETLRQVLADSRTPAGDRGPIRLLLGRLLRWYGQTGQANREIEAAIPDLAGMPGQACRAMMNLGHVFSSEDWPVRRHLEWIERATRQLDRIESDAERLSVQAVRVVALLGLGEQEGWRAAEEFPRTGSSQAEQRTILGCSVDVARAAIIWGRHTEARTRLDAAVEPIKTAGLRRSAGLVRAGYITLDWYTGRWAGLPGAAAELAESEETELECVRREAREIQGLLELASGAREVAEQRLGDVHARARTGMLEPDAARSAAALGRIHLADGDAEKALEVAGPVMDMIARRRVWLWAAELAPVHLDALVATGRIDQAAALAGQFTDWLGGRDAALAPVAASVLCQAIVAQAHSDLHTAAELFAESASAWSKQPRPYDELLTRERQGRCLLEAGLTDDGLKLLADARPRLQKQGALWDADRIALLLRQHGVKIPPSRLHQPRQSRNDQLTPREREVVTLVAKGMTNRQVAQTLYLSPKTVSAYLSTAMRKLNVTSRTAAAIAIANTAPPQT